MRPVRLGHVPALDGVRGIAIALVVLAHSEIYAHLPRWGIGFALGVDLFFVLSGFLITSLLLDEWAERGRVSLRGFYARRARRLLPALALIVAVFAAADLVLHPASATQTIAYALLRMAYLSNFLIAFTPNGVGGGFNHLWSLASEEQFYLVWPLLLLFALRRKARARELLVILAITELLVNVERLLALEHGASWVRLWFAPDTHSDAIILGCAAAVVRSHQLFTVGRRTGIFAAAVSVVMLFVFRPQEPAMYPVVLPLFAVAAALFLLSVVNEEQSAQSRVLTCVPLGQLGAISYSLYLWHFPLLEFFGIVGLPLAVAASIVSYVFVEKPLRRRRHPEPIFATSG